MLSQYQIKRKINATGNHGEVTNYLAFVKFYEILHSSVCFVQISYSR